VPPLRGRKPRCSSRGSSTSSIPWGGCRRRLEELEQEREAQGDADALERLEALRRAHRDSETEAGEASSEAGRLESEVSRRRDERREQQEALNEVRSRLQTRRGRQASLEALQQAARDRAEGKGVGDWLAQQGLAEAPRVLDSLVVDPRWQRAVEVVLGSALQGVCVDSASTSCSRRRAGRAGGR
jgi:chromosome segregation protein